MQQDPLIKKREKTEKENEKETKEQKYGEQEYKTHTKQIHIKI